MFEAFDEDMNMIDEMGKVYCDVFCFFVETEKKRKETQKIMLFYSAWWLLFLEIFDELCMNVYEYDVEDDEEEEERRWRIWCWPTTLNTMDIQSTG